VSIAEASRERRNPCLGSPFLRTEAADGTEPPEAYAAGLQRRAKLGAVALAIRTILVQLAILVGGVALRRELAVADFGAIAIAQVTLQFLFYFGDAGFGGALIQKDQEPSQRELSSIWCLQLLIAATIVGVIWIAAPWMVEFWPDLAQSGVWLFRALSVNLLLTAARVVPTVLMERELQYTRLSILEVLLVVPYYGVALILARAGWGLFAIVAAILVQGAFGVVGAFAMRPWRPSLMIDRHALRPILRFGVAFQLKNVVGFASSAITPVYAGRALGQAQLGLLGWAQETAYFPLKLVEIISRISFPLYSRLQNDRELLASLVERSVQLCAMGTLFFVGLVLGLGPNIAVVIYTSKWLPAVPMLYVYAVSIAFGFLTPLVAPLFDALGNPKLNLKFSIGWTVAIAVLVPLTTPRWGALGYSIGYCLPVVVGNCGVLYVLKRQLPKLRVWVRLRASSAGALIVALLGRYLLAPWAAAPHKLLLAVLAEMAAFALTMTLLDRSSVRDALSLLPKAQKARNVSEDAPLL
jgi:O-antigen/teichoic acid export membrane protein